MPPTMAGAFPAVPSTTRAKPNAPGPISAPCTRPGSPKRRSPRIAEARIMRPGLSFVPRGTADASPARADGICPELEHMRHVPEAYDIPRRKLGNSLPWLTAFSIAALVIGATVALVLAGG